MDQFGVFYVFELGDIPSEHLSGRWLLDQANVCALGMGKGPNYCLISRFEIYAMRWTTMSMFRDVDRRVYVRYKFSASIAYHQSLVREASFSSPSRTLFVTCAEIFWTRYEMRQTGLFFSLHGNSE